jgi:hypothetical protein
MQSRRLRTIFKGIKNSYPRNVANLITNSGYHNMETSSSRLNHWRGYVAPWFTAVKTLIYHLTIIYFNLLQVIESESEL